MQSTRASANLSGPRSPVQLGALLGDHRYRDVLASSLPAEVYFNSVTASINSVDLICFFRTIFWFIISVDSVCMYACVYVCTYVCLSLCQTITFERLHIGNSHLHIRCISTQYGSSSYMKVIRSRSRSQEQKRSTAGTHATDACPQRKNSVANNSASVTHIAVKCAYSVGLTPTADRLA